MVLDRCAQMQHIQERRGEYGGESKKGERRRNILAAPSVSLGRIAAAARLDYHDDGGGGGGGGTDPTLVYAASLSPTHRHRSRLSLTRKAEHANAPGEKVLMVWGSIRSKFG